MLPARNLLTRRKSFPTTDTKVADLSFLSAKSIWSPPSVATDKRRESPYASLKKWIPRFGVRKIPSILSAVTVNMFSFIESPPSLSVGIMVAARLSKTDVPTICSSVSSAIEAVMMYVVYSYDSWIWHHCPSLGYAISSKVKHVLCSG